MSSRKEQLKSNCVFAIGEMDDGGPPLLMVGFPKGAIRKMQKKKQTLNFDLTSAGYPVRVVFFAEETHEACMKILDDHNKRIGQTYSDERNKDFSLKEK